MAWTFSEQIHALTGLDAASNSDSETGEDYRVLSAQWLTDAVREVINILPPKLKEKCITESILTNSPTSMDMDGKGDIISVTRRYSDSGYWVNCRKVSTEYSSLTQDSTSLHYATVTDPVYYIQSQSDISTLFVQPTPTANQTAIIYHVGNPSIAYGDTSIANFPDEAEYLVPLRAAITAAEYQLAIEEDAELYMPVIATLKAQYQEGVMALQTGSITPQRKGGQ